MKKVIKSTLAILSCLTALVFSSCQEEDLEKPEQPVQFSFSTTDLSENGRVADIDDIRAIVITVKNSSGETVLDMEKVMLYDVKGKFLSEPVKLKPGEYQLTHFMVVDENDNVLYITPKEGSKRAHLIQDPLPILFRTGEAGLNEVTVAVLAIEDDPEAYGYVSYSLYVEETFSFRVQAFLINEGEFDPYDWDIPRMERTTAHIEIIYRENTIYEGDLHSAGDLLYLKSNIRKVTIRVTKEHYYPYQAEFTQSELKATLDEPLQIVLRQDEPFKFVTRSSDGIGAIFVPSAAPNKLLYTTGKGLWKIDISDLKNPGEPVFIGPYTGFPIAEDHYGTLFMDEYFSSDAGETWQMITVDRPVANFVEINGIHYGMNEDKLYRETGTDQWELINDLPSSDLIAHDNRLFTADATLYSEDGVIFEEVPMDFEVYQGDFIEDAFTAGGRLFLFIDYTPPGLIYEWDGVSWKLNNVIYLVDTDFEFNLFADGYRNHMILVEKNTLKIFDMTACNTENCEPNQSIFFNWDPAQYATTVYGKYIGGDKVFIQTDRDDYGRTHLYAADLKQFID